MLVALMLAAALASPAADEETPTESTPIDWSTKANTLNGAVGKEFLLTCPASGSLNVIWGSDVYTADSSVCTAAVHAGRITLSRGGTVLIQMRPGREMYGSTTRHNVHSSSYGAYAESYVFLPLPTPAPGTPKPAR